MDWSKRSNGDGMCIFLYVNMMNWTRKRICAADDRRQGIDKQENPSHVVVSRSHDSYQLELVILSPEECAETKLSRARFENRVEVKNISVS